VLHDGSAPYPQGPQTLKALHAAGHRLGVLSNSGKRADVNAQRIARMGYPEHLFDVVMTSGEALWQDFDQGRMGHLRKLYAITAKAGDAESWAEGLDRVQIVADPATADAVLLMGLADDADSNTVRAQLDTAPLANLPMLCSNPDRAAPRAGGKTVVSPGALAHARALAGGDVRFYGKPHQPVFDALQRALNCPPERILMIGDSFEHDIAGGHGAGWKTLFIRGGLYGQHFDGGVGVGATIERLAARSGSPPPDFTLDQVC
jgi:HAD superfamily hydrolase (TIGR01459 family)